MACAKKYLGTKIQFNFVESFDGENYVWIPKKPRIDVGFRFDVQNNSMMTFYRKKELEYICVFPLNYEGQVLFTAAHYNPPALDIILTLNGENGLQKRIIVELKSHHTYYRSTYRSWIDPEIFKKFAGIKTAITIHFRRSEVVDSSSDTE